MKLKFYSFFTKHSLLENYGFTAGLFSKIFRKFVPKIPAEDTFEFYLKQSQFGGGNFTTIANTIDELLSDPEVKISIAHDLNKAIVALSSKIISFGLDHEFQTIFEKLKIDSKCYRSLMFKISILSEHGETPIKEFYKNLDEVSKTIINLRKNKNVIGTSLHLTVVTRRILDYIKRIRSLLDLKKDINSKEKWKQLITEYQMHDASKNSIRKYFSSHLDLMALEIVEHTSKKGEGYVANNKQEYWKFFKKSLLGGAVISVFALFKIIIDSYFSTSLLLAFLYSVNYAICFILVKSMGGIIATKQPAMTASTVIRHIDKNDNLKLGSFQDIIFLIRKVSRSQFISLLGNFIMAFSLSCLLAYLLRLGFIANPINSGNSTKLVQEVFPFSAGAIYFAAVAGVFLSISGFVSGYFDNKVVASKLPYRILHNQFLSRVLSQKNSNRLANFIEIKLGVLAGNVSLGVFLGSAFLLTYILPFNFDIRHIAFSSSNVGYGISNQFFDLSTIALALVSVMIIGFVNFIVSFSITFLLALKSRSITISTLRRLIVLSLKDILRNPLNYLIVRTRKSLVSNQKVNQDKMIGR